MDSWDVTTLDVEVHKPAVLKSEDGVASAVAVNLPAGDLLQDHETHEHVYLVVVDGELEIEHTSGTDKAGVGFTAHFEPHERREVRATQDARFLLFLAPWPGEGHHT